jgi:hypothetical protein
MVETIKSIVGYGLIIVGIGIAGVVFTRTKGFWYSEEEDIIINIILALLGVISIWLGFRYFLDAGPLGSLLFTAFWFYGGGIVVGSFFILPKVIEEFKENWYHNKKEFFIHVFFATIIVLLILITIYVWHITTPEGLIKSFIKMAEDLSKR